MSNIAFLLRGKKILITSYSYAAFGGAELNAVELAEQLVEFGMKPTFYSYDIDGPLKKHIEEQFKTQVMTDQINNLSESDDNGAMGVTELDINDYDYIWVAGNTVPISILKQINTAKKLPKFIFIHMSALIAFALDAPLLPDFEKIIATKILSISEKTTTDNIQRILGEDTQIAEWRNPVPKTFKQIPKRSGQLRKVAVISSSHPGKEVTEIRGILENQGIEVDLIGKFNDNVKVVDASFYNEYDLIVGIGKNCRYSLVSGVPVYVYGRFGGGGYIDEDNYELNEAENFSGRGFQKKSSEVIAEEITSGYNRALQYHEAHREKFIEELSIDNVALNLFTELEQEPNKQITFDDIYQLAGKYAN